MTDSIDIASQNEEEFRQYLIKNHKFNYLIPKGKCYNCEYKTKFNFCCKECGEDWEQRKFFESQKIR